MGPIESIAVTYRKLLQLKQEVTWMSTYVPGFWSQQYENLSNSQRTQINKKVDEAFRRQTGISRPLNPKTDRVFVNQWLRVRDEVMAEQSRQGATSTRKTGFGKFGMIPGKPNERQVLLYNYDVNASHMKPEHQRFLDRSLIPFINVKSLEVWVAVVGTASRTGSDGYDQSLSETRAAIVQSYLRQRAIPSVNFVDPVGWGKQPKRKDSSSDEDERDRAVIVVMGFRPPNPIPPVTRTTYSAAEWARIFDQAYKNSAVSYTLDAAFNNIADYSPTPKSIPTSVPNSWKGSPAAAEVAAALRKGAIDLVKDAVRKQKLDIPDAEIEQQFDTWFKNQQHK
jgi:outer membrane protein OmpA-like peptidoglycan-associated protein